MGFVTQLLNFQERRERLFSLWCPILPIARQETVPRACEADFLGIRVLDDQPVKPVLTAGHCIFSKGERSSIAGRAASLR